MLSKIKIRPKGTLFKPKQQKRDLHLARKHVEPSAVSIHGIVGHLHMPATSRKIHIADEILAKSYAKSKSYAKKGKNVKGLSGVNIQSLQASHSQSIDIMVERGLAHMGHHMSVLIEAITGGTMPTVKQVQSIEKKYIEYYDFCLNRKQKPIALRSFMDHLVKQGEKQGISCQGLSEEDVLLLQHSILIGDYKYEAASHIYNEFQFRHVHGPSMIVQLSEATKVSRLEGEMGKKFSQDGSVGVFFSPGIHVQDMVDSPLQDEMLIHPITMHQLLAIGVGARQVLTDKRLVIPAQSGLIKLQNGDLPLPEELDALDKWSKCYNSNHDQDKTFLIEYELAKGDLVGVGASVSPRGMLTVEVYPINPNPAKWICKRIDDGVNWTVYCPKAGKLVDTIISQDARKHDLEVVIPKFNSTPEHAICTKIEGTPEELRALTKQVHAEIDRELRDEQQFSIPKN